MNQATRNGFGLQAGMGMCWYAVALWVNAMPVRKTPAAWGFIFLFSFFPNGLSYLEITLPESPRSIVKNCLCGEAELLLFLMVVYWSQRLWWEIACLLNQALLQDIFYPLLFMFCLFVVVFRCGVGRSLPGFVIMGISFFIEVKKYSAWKCLQLKRIKKTSPQQNRREW